jgi:hypothetical protein
VALELIFLAYLCLPKKRRGIFVAVKTAMFTRVRTVNQLVQGSR